MMNLKIFLSIVSFVSAASAQQNCPDLGKKYQDAVNAEQSAAINYLNATQREAGIKSGAYVRAKSYSRRALTDLNNSGCSLPPIEALSIDEIKSKVTISLIQDRLDVIISGETDRKSQENQIRKNLNGT